MIKNIILNLLSRYYSKKYNRHILVGNIFPFEAIDLSSINITDKGKAYVEYFKDNPNATEEDFNSYYQSK